MDKILDRENPIKFKMFRAAGVKERAKAALAGGAPVKVENPLNSPEFCRHAGDVMWTARMEAGLTVTELASKAGVSPAEITNMEMGLLCPHDITFILKVAIVFGRAIHYEIEEQP